MIKLSYLMIDTDNENVKKNFKKPNKSSYEHGFMHLSNNLYVNCLVSRQTLLVKRTEGGERYINNGRYWDEKK
jgi:hypothetical protein